MSYLIAAPAVLSAAATQLAGIGSAINAANASAAAPTISILTAAEDEVSAAAAALFGTYARQYQALGTQVAAFHDQFVRALATGGGSYAAAEAANASPLQFLEQGVLGVINAPTQALMGRPLIGNGTNGSAAGEAGGAGGLLYGNGGTGADGGPGQAGGNGGSAGFLGNGGAGGAGGAGAVGGSGGSGGLLYGNGGAGGHGGIGAAGINGGAGGRGGSGGSANLFGAGGNGGQGGAGATGTTGNPTPVGTAPNGNPGMDVTGGFQPCHRR